MLAICQAISNPRLVQLIMRGSYWAIFMGKMLSKRAPPIDISLNARQTVGFRRCHFHCHCTPAGWRQYYILLFFIQILRWHRLDVALKYHPLWIRQIADRLHAVPSPAECCEGGAHRAVRVFQPEIAKMVTKFSHNRLKTNREDAKLRLRLDVRIFWNVFIE